MSVPELAYDAANAFLFLAVLRTVKFAGHAAARPSFGDVLWAASLAAVPALAELAAGRPGRFVGSAGVLVLLVILWLGIASWRVFTVEIGPLTLSGLVLSLFFRESFQVNWVRDWILRFLRDNPGFAVLPLMAAGWLGTGFLPPPSRAAASLVVTAAVAAWLGTLPAKARLAPWLCCAVAAASGAAAWSGFAVRQLTWRELASVPVFLLAGRMLRRRGLLRASLAGDCLRPRPWPATTCRSCAERCARDDEPEATGAARATGQADLVDAEPPAAMTVGAESVRAQLRPAGAALAGRLSFPLATRTAVPRTQSSADVFWDARPPAPAPYAGALPGTDILLITLESVGRDHLAMFAPDGARTPFIDGLFARAAVSGSHIAPSPLTTNAHVLLGYGRYRADGESQLQRLAAAGYRTAYLTSARTRYNGLSRIIARSGYQTLVDRARLGPTITDRDLPGAGVDALVAELSEVGSSRRRPLFLHAHTCDTHVPYRVRDPRFRRRDDSRRGRFLDAIEEADDTLARLYDALIERGVLRDPLVVVTSDHGEAFGFLGYHFHATAVTAEQTLVPFALAHPALPRVTVPWSSHLDVLPTVLALAGVPPAPTHGDSLFRPERHPRLVLWAGNPLRSATSCYGLLDGRRKLMVDLAIDRCLDTGWEDTAIRVLHGRERQHAQAVTTAAFRRLRLD